MKRLLMIGFLLVAVFTTTLAQLDTKQLSLFKQFKPATIHMSSGKVVRASQANVFLKNGALLFLRGEYTMEANMGTINRVLFDSLTFVNIENQLALLVDSVGKNRLYCVTLIDMEAYIGNLKNSVILSSNPFEDLMNGSDQLSYTTVELENREDMSLPLIRQFYYLYNGEIVKVHEREISRKIPKTKRHIYRSIMALPDFSWLDVQSLMKMLKAISVEEKK